jgi:transposase InsO family protein
VFDRILADTGIRTVLSGVRRPRTNSIMERWVQELRHELLDRTLRTPTRPSRGNHPGVPDGPPDLRGRIFRQAQAWNWARCGRSPQWLAARLDLPLALTELLVAEARATARHTPRTPRKRA